MTTYAKYLRRGRPFAYTLRSGRLRKKGIVFAIDERDAFERAAGIARSFYGDEWGVLEVQRVKLKGTNSSTTKTSPLRKRRKGTLPKLKGWKRRLTESVT